MSARPIDDVPDRTRRLLLGGAMVTALAACGVPPRPGSSSTGAASIGPAPTPATAASASELVQASAVPSPSQSSMAPAVPSSETEASIVARYAGRAPAQWGLDVTGVISRTSSTSVVLTFDACGGSGGTGYDEPLITTLRQLSVPATLFLNARWIDANPALAAELAADPLFEVANHGFRHVPLSVAGQSAYGIAGTTSVAEIYHEIADGVPWFVSATGGAPRWFRPGTAFSDDIGAAIARDLGQPLAGFSVNGDAGATYSPAQVAQTVGGVAGGDIVISHFNRPGRGTAAGYAQALPALLDRGVTFTTMARAAS